MRTAGLMMNDVWAHRVLREQGVETYRYENLDASLSIMVESVELKHRSKEENYRPYLHVVGELRSIVPGEGLPYGISEITYSPGKGEKVDAYYEFDDQQLVALASKGYFSREFQVPEVITGIEWELPSQVDALVLAPSGSEGDAPVVFTQVHDIASLDVDLETSEYDLTDYFADFSKEGVSHEIEQAVDERSLRARSDAINSLFTEEELALAEHDAQGYRAPAAKDDAGVSSETAVETQLQQIEAEVAAEAERFRAERERQEGTPENLYHERVASALADDAEVTTRAEVRERKRQQEQRQEPTEVTEHSGVLDLDEALDLEAAEERQSRIDKRKRDVSRRAADLDFGDERDHSLGS